MRALVNLMGVSSINSVAFFFLEATPGEAEAKSLRVKRDEHEKDENGPSKAAKKGLFLAPWDGQKVGSIRIEIHFTSRPRERKRYAKR